MAKLLATVCVLALVAAFLAGPVAEARQLSGSDAAVQEVSVINGRHLLQNVANTCIADGVASASCIAQAIAILGNADATAIATAINPNGPATAAGVANALAVGGNADATSDVTAISGR